jgi:hypothetical protein
VRPLFGEGLRERWSIIERAAQAVNARRGARENSARSPGARGAGAGRDAYKCTVCALGRSGPPWHHPPLCFGPKRLKMRPYVDHERVEALLAPDARARLPLRFQLVLYLDPFALFKDASQGPAWMRERALAYNRAKRWMLLAYIRRWAVIAGVLLAAIAPTEALAAERSLAVVLPAAAAAVGFCVAVTVALVSLAVYLLLGARADRA